MTLQQQGQIGQDRTPRISSNFHCEYARSNLEVLQNLFTLLLDDDDEGLDQSADEQFH